jgi:spermidine/putrescine-binding protein
VERRRGGPAANASTRHVETDEDDPKRTNRDDRPVEPLGATLSRRVGLVMGATAFAQAVPDSHSTFLAPPRASAKLALEYDGVPAVAYAFDATLEVVALRGSVPSQWEAEFNRTLRKGKLSLSTAATPRDAYEALRRASAANANAGALPGTSAMPRPGVPGPAGFAPPTPAQLAAAADARKNEPKRKTAKDGKKSKTAKADVVSLGDEFLSAAVANGLIVPLDSSVTTKAWYARLPARWRRLASRDPDGTLAPPPPPTVSSASNQRFGSSVVYGVPYRWGATLIAFRSDKLPKATLDAIARSGGIDWSDLWRPELRGRVAFGGGPRALLTASLRAEGLSANDPRGVGASPEVLRRLRALRDDQLLTTDDTQYAQALANGDAWAIVGPSDDLLALARRSSLVTVAAPRTGTSLFADVWCVPATAAAKPGGVSPLVDQWFDYTTQPARANLRSGLRGGVATVAFDGSRVDYGVGRLDGPAGGFAGAFTPTNESSLSAFIRDALAGGTPHPGTSPGGACRPTKRGRGRSFSSPSRRARAKDTTRCSSNGADRVDDVLY